MRNTDRLALDGGWRRAGKYQLADGILLAASRQFRTYDPWAGYWANVGVYRTVEQPYLALLELRRELTALKQAGIEPTRLLGESLSSPRDLTNFSAADELILAWCCDHGLLGLLPVLASRVELPVQLPSSSDDGIDVQRTQYFRQGGRWDEHTDTMSGRTASTDEREPMTTWIAWVSGAMHDRPTYELQAYFPHAVGGATQFVPPLPLSPAFWSSYGEPIWEFAQYTEFFGTAVDALAAWPGEALPQSQRPTAERAFAFLSSLALAVAPRFQYDAATSRAREERVSAGLLASYALMMLWDYERGRRARRCDRCDKYFVSNERRTRYCSTSCRNTMQSRRHRAKKRGSQADIYHRSGDWTP